MEELKSITFGLGVKIPGCRITTSVVCGTPEFLDCKIYREVKEGVSVYHIHNVKVNQVVTVPANNVAAYICYDYDLCNTPDVASVKAEVPVVKRRGRPPMTEKIVDEIGI